MTLLINYLKFSSLPNPSLEVSRIFFISEIENSRIIFKAYARTNFSQQSSYFCFVSEVKNCI